MNTRKWIVLAVIILGLAITIQGGVALAGLLHTPHENPNDAEASVYAPAYLLLCSDAIDIVLSDDDRSIDEIFENLEDANIPDELATILRLFRELLTELSNDLDQLEANLDTAQSLLDQNQLGEAEQRLNNAASLIIETEDLIEDIQNATDTLYNRLGRLVMIPGVEDKIAEAYSVLQDNIERLRELKEQYARLLERLQAELVAKQENLIPTELALALGAEEAFVGEDIDVSGTLSSGDSLLPERELTILLDGQSVATTQTNNSGFYNATVEVPYKYISEMTVQAEYVPTGADIDVYFGCLSPEVELRVLFYETELTLSSGTHELFVGETTDVSGALTSPGNPTPTNREVEILLDGEMVASTSTDSYGSYSTRISIPYRYVSEMTLQSRYLPKGDPGDIYQGSHSPTVQLTTLFYHTSVEFSAPSEALPGASFSVSGEVSSDGPDTPERVVRATLGSQSLARITATGSFEFTATPASNTPEDTYPFAVTVEPYGVYAGASRELPLSIVKRSSEIDFSAPTITLSPRTVKIRGEVWSEEYGPISGATITASLGDLSSTAKTSEDGKFTISLSLPMNVGQVPSEELVVEADPAEPWFKSCQKTKRIFIANPLIVGLTATAVVSLGLVVYRGRGGLVQERVTPSIDPKLLEQITPISAATATGVLGAYIRALRCVEDATGVMLRPEMTLRDFLDEVSPHPDLATAASAFEELTLLAEKALYSPHVFGESEEIQAEGLSHIVEEEVVFRI